jgi:hypothetical protein
VRAETPRGFLDLNMDALAAGFAVTAKPIPAAVS